MTMITIDAGHTRFHVRVVAVCLHEEHVLLHQAEGQAWWLLPGGRPELGESLRETIARELTEELGVTAEIGRLLWIVENFFTFQDRSVHELAFYFLVTLPFESDYVDLERVFHATDAGIALEFRWFRLASLGDIQIVPSFLTMSLLDLPETTVHIVHHG